MERFDRDSMREAFGRLGWALMASQLLILGLVLAGSLLFSLLMQLFSPLNHTWEQVYGYFIILSVCVGALPLLHLVYTEGCMGRMLERGEKIWPVQLVFYFLMVLGLQITVALLTTPVVQFLESLGLSFTDASEAATSFSTAGSLLFYSIAIAPICEEIMYRGCLLRYLEKYGRWFAVCVSALIFGLMHGNAVQFPVAFVIGLVFGHLALKHSLRLVILLHVMNNLFVELIGRIAAQNAALGGVINLAIMIAGVISLILVALSGGKPLLRDLRANKTAGAVYKTFFSCFPVAAICIYMLILTVASVLV